MLAIDFGFSGTKAQCDHAFYACQSAITDVTSSTMSFNRATANIYELEGRKYMFGDLTLSRSDQIYVLEAAWLLKMTPLAIAHAMTMMKCLPENEKVVVLGLPPEYFKKYWPELKERAQSFVVNGQQYTFDRVSIVPQGVGAFYDFVSRNDIADDEASLLVDIGANTVNMMIAQGEDVIPEYSKQLEKSGACVAGQKVINLLQAQKGVRISHPQVHKILRTGMHNKVVVPELPGILSEYANYVVNEVINTYSTLTLSRIIFSGGGAELIRDYLPKKIPFSGEIGFIENPLFSNVRGYYLAGVISLKQSLGLDT